MSGFPTRLEDTIQVTTQKIQPACDSTQAEDAANSYASVFKTSKIGRISRYRKRRIAE
jgi:predicted 3-demethylubiquinone-9 3-methyltransferase (glyoxalase superfamily)